MHRNKKRRREGSAWENIDGIGVFWHKIDSVKHFPLHPLGKSVAARFRRDDTEDKEVDEGAKEAE